VGGGNLAFLDGLLQSCEPRLPALVVGKGQDGGAWAKVAETMFFNLIDCKRYFKVSTPCASSYPVARDYQFSNFAQGVVRIFLQHQNIHIKFVVYFLSHEAGVCKGSGAQQLKGKLLKLQMDSIAQQMQTQRSACAVLFSLMLCFSKCGAMSESFTNSSVVLPGDSVSGLYRRLPPYLRRSWRSSTKSTYAQAQHASLWNTWKDAQRDRSCFSWAREARARLRAASDT